MVLVLSVFATLLATYSVSLTSRARDLARLSTLIGWTTNAINERLQIYSCGLIGGAAFFAAHETPNVEEFRKYAARLDLHSLYPGIQGFGFAKRALPAQLESLVEKMRAQGASEFTVKPPGEREEYFPIVYLEPQDRRNQTAIGYDMFSESVRREAMMRARDEGKPAASGQVKLIQEIDADTQPGFLLYVPVYEGGEIPAKRDRRSKLIGFVYSPFRARDLFSGIFHPTEDSEVALQVFDGPAVDTTNLLYRSPRLSADRPGRYIRSQLLQFGGHQWTLRLETTPVFEQGSNGHLVPWVLVTGCVLSVILYAITGALARAHQRLQQAQSELQAHAETLEQAVAARTARLQEAIGELEQMSYSMVHDMRAPLRAIQSFGGMLEDEAGPGLTAQCRNYIQRMRIAAGRMDALVRDVLNYSKVVREELPLSPVNVVQLLRGILDTYPSLQSVEADIQLDPSIPPVLGNEGALTQCFANLLNNAVRFAKPGFKPRINITGEPRHAKVRICVADEGVGIPQELQEKVFRMFQRLNHSQEGTGMGLAIVRKATERMGGKVWVESEPDRFTRIYLEFAAAPVTGDTALPK